MSNILFRCNASENTSIGHLMRCSNLGVYIRKQFSKKNLSCEIYFLLGAPSRVIPLNFPFSIFYTNTNIVEKDADTTCDFLCNYNISKLFVDSYFLESKWEKYVKSKCSVRLCSIDDLQRCHYSDYILDYSFLGLPFDKLGYVNQNKNAKNLFGFKYCILNNNLKKKDKRQISSVKNIMVNFGGNCPLSVYKYVLGILIGKSYFSNYIWYIVFGNTICDKEYWEYLMDFKNIKVNGFVNMSEFLVLQNIDLCIGSFGTSLYERAFLGIPTIGITFVKAEIALAEKLHNIHLAKYIGHVGHIEHVDSKNFEKCIDNFMYSVCVWVYIYSARCLEYFSEKGQENIFKVIFGK